MRFVPFFPIRMGAGAILRDCLLGISLSLGTLLLILMAHEMGHYLYCRFITGFMPRCRFSFRLLHLIGTLER